MRGEQAAFVLIGVSHVIALVALLWMLFSAKDRPFGLGWWLGPDEDQGPGPTPDPVAPGGAALPLPTGQPSAVRLRGPGRLADAHPRPPRRPDHAPQPARAPQR